MADDVHTHIEALVAEEHRLWQHESGGNGSEAADAGANPDDVEMRSEGTVEGYLQ